MSQPTDAMDFRRADEPALLQALGEGLPLALAEAYHRSVPAAHAVARRLLGGVSDVESLLLTVYTQLWEDPPQDGPLEGWIRRTTWARGAERLRAQQTAPASPSTAGLLPDLPAPDVRFLDAAERAIAELPDEARRALLLAHDKGVPSDAQDPGAGLALTQALMTLAGPETSSSDRSVLDEDGCEDVPTMGDWCLGLLAPTSASTVTQAIDERSGCAAVSRAVRRGRRRVEGLPATPDMGQRILVSVLTGSSRPLAGAVPAAQAPSGVATPDEAMEDTQAMPAQEITTPGTEAPGAAIPGTAIPGTAASGMTTPADADVPVDPSAAPPDDAAPAQPAQDDAAVEGGAEDDAPEQADRFDEVGAYAGMSGIDEEPAADAGDTGADTADMPQAEAEDTPSGSWIPGPGDNTAELRLSDILSDDEDEEDDPFADLHDTGAPAETPATGISQPGRRDPYSALRGLEDEPDERPLTPQGPVSPAFANPETVAGGPDLADDESLVGDYVEGQEDDYLDAAQPSRTAAVMAWVLPILGGGILGTAVAIGVFGLPGS